MDATMDMTVARAAHRGTLLAGGTLLGMGLGGFLDGILLHQLLQWHNMLSSVVPPTDLVAAKYNMFWDGVFHAATWVITAVGLALVFRAGQHNLLAGRTRTFVGTLALGWGLFNVVEGLIDHQILGLHHVHPGAGQQAWDITFLLFGATLVAGGLAAISVDARRGASAQVSPSPDASRPPGPPRPQPSGSRG